MGTGFVRDPSMTARLPSGAVSRILTRTATPMRTASTAATTAATAALAHRWWFTLIGRRPTPDGSGQMLPIRGRLTA